MTLSELMAYADEMPILRAEGQLDAAQVALYPMTAQYAPELAREWWNALAETAAGGQESSSIVPSEGMTGFALNNRAVTFDELAAQLGQMLGGGLAA